MERNQLWGKIRASWIPFPRFNSAVSPEKQCNCQEKGKKSSLWSRLLNLIRKKNHKIWPEFPECIGEAVERIDIDETLNDFAPEFSECIGEAVERVDVETQNDFATEFPECIGEAVDRVEPLNVFDTEFPECIGEAVQRVDVETQNEFATEFPECIGEAVERVEPLNDFPTEFPECIGEAVDRVEPINAFATEFPECIGEAVDRIETLSVVASEFPECVGEAVDRVETLNIFATKFPKCIGEAVGRVETLNVFGTEFPECIGEAVERVGILNIFATEFPECIGEAVEKVEILNLYPILQELFKCTICLEVFVKATELDCRHNFCEYCLDNWRVQNSRKKCPLCRADINNPTLNFLLNEFIEQSYEAATGDIKAKREALIYERANSFRAELNAAALRAVTTNAVTRPATAPAQNNRRTSTASEPTGGNEIHEPTRTVTVQDWVTTLRTGNRNRATLGRRINQAQTVEENQVSPVPPVQTTRIVATAQRPATAPAQNNRRILTTSEPTGANATSRPNHYVTVHDWPNSLRSGNGYTSGFRVRQPLSRTRHANRRGYATSQTAVNARPSAPAQAGQRRSTRLNQVVRTSVNTRTQTTAPRSISANH